VSDGADVRCAGRLSEIGGGNWKGLTADSRGVTNKTALSVGRMWIIGRVLFEMARQ